MMVELICKAIAKAPTLQWPTRGCYGTINSQRPQPPPIQETFYELRWHCPNTQQAGFSIGIPFSVPKQSPQKSLGPWIYGKAVTWSNMEIMSIKDHQLMIFNIWKFHIIDAMVVPSL